MPIYEYVCHVCGKEFELVQNLAEHEKAEVKCPDCYSEKVERRYTHVETITSKKS